MEITEAQRKKIIDALDALEGLIISASYEYGSCQTIAGLRLDADPDVEFLDAARAALGVPL